MPKPEAVLLALTIPFLILGCDAEGAGVGEEGGACQSDGSCNAGLVCVSATCVDEGLTPDAGGRDGGPEDAGPADAGPRDAGPEDAGSTDAGPLDAGPEDAGSTDAGPTDAGPTDAGPADAGPPPLASCVAGEDVTADATVYTLRTDGLQILDAMPNLNADGFQNFRAYTCDVPSTLRLNIFQTGVTDIRNGWDEERDLPTASSTEATTTTPALANADFAVDHVDTIPALTGDDKTLFNSDDVGGLTYALRVYDAAGDLADCLAWGHDVPGMFDGRVPNNNPSGPTAFSEITAANCTVPE